MKIAKVLKSKKFQLTIILLISISLIYPCTPEQRILKFKYRNEMKTDAGQFQVMLKLSDWNFPKSTEGVSGYNPDCRPSLTADGRYLVFHSQPMNGPAYGGVSYGNGWNSYIARWNGNAWDSITNLGPVVNPASYPYISADGNKIYFDRGGDIWVTTKMIRVGIPRSDCRHQLILRITKRVDQRFRLMGEDSILNRIEPAAMVQWISG